MQYKLYQTLLIVSTHMHSRVQTEKMDVNHVHCILIPFRLYSKLDSVFILLLKWIQSLVQK